MADINRDACRRWRVEHLEASFPDPLSRGFLRVIHLNWTEAEQGSSFPAFKAEMKKLNRKYRKYDLFLVWLYLCIRRPWLKRVFPHSAIALTKVDMGKITDILAQLERGTWGDVFPDAYPGESTLRAKVKNIRLISRVLEAYYDFEGALIKQGLTYDEINRLNRETRQRLLNPQPLPKRYRVNPFEVNSLLPKLCELLTAEPIIKVRDIQRKFHWKAEVCKAVVHVAELEGWIKLQKFSQNSLWVVLKEKRIWEWPPDGWDKLCRLCLKSPRQDS